MKTLIVTHYFPPEIGAPQARLSEFAREWASAGDDVTVLTGMPNHPTGIVPDEYRRKARLVERSEGYRVVRTWLYATPNEGIAKKTLGHLSFMVSSVALGWRASGPADVVVVSSPTFFSIFSAWALAKVKRARLIVEIRDLWPAIFVELGVLRNPWIIRALEALEMWAYRVADAVVVVSEGFKDDLVRRGIPADKVTTIRNGADLERFQPSEPSESVRTSMGAETDECLVLYIGAHGISHGLETVADAAALLADEPVHFCFVGEGARKAALAEHVERLGMANVTMLPGVPREEVAGLLAAADICLVPLRDVPLFSTFIPSKIFEYFAAGKAVIGAVSGEPAQILDEGGAVVVAPGDSHRLAGAIRSLSRDPSRRTSMSERARTYVAANFDRSQLASRYRRVLAAVAASDEDRKR